MPIYEITQSAIRRLSETTLGAAGIRERADLQRLLQANIDVDARKAGIVSGGTKHSAIWPSGVAGLYTIFSVEEASRQDFAGAMPATGGSLPSPDLR
jgi:hypothetical protein